MTLCKRDTGDKVFKRIPWKTNLPIKLPGHKMRSCTYIGLGVNIGAHGERLRLLMLALQKINRLPATRVLAVSSLYETPPWGITNQPVFYNAVAAIQTNLSPPALLHALKSIETQLGRKTRTRWGPREIDLDILLTGQLITKSHGLNIPHKNMIHRHFVLVPLLDVAPSLPMPAGPLAVSYIKRTSYSTSDLSKTIRKISPEDIVPLDES